MVAHRLYTQASHDVSVFANGAQHQLRFEATVFGGHITSFFIDDVSLSVMVEP